MRIGYLMEAGVPDVREPHPTGAANHVRHSIAELRRLGHEVRLLARLDGQLWLSDDLDLYRPVHLQGIDDGPRRLAERGVRRVQSQFGLPYISYFDSRRFAAACVRELKDCDLLYERMGWMGLGGGVAAARLGIPHVLEVNGDLLPELSMLGLEPRYLQRTLSLRLMGRMARSATHAVATGEGWQTKHIQQWQVDPLRVSVVQNGSSLVDLLPREKLRSFGRQRRADEPLRVAFVGSFEPWQGLSLLLNAVGKLTAAGVNLQVTLAGAGRLEPALRELTTGLSLSGRVCFTGHLPLADLAVCLSQCDVGVCLYDGRVEYTGLKLLDYKAAGLASIAVGERKRPGLVTHDVTGLIIAPGDEAGLCSALTHLASSLDRTSEFGRRARLEAEVRHSWRHTAEELNRLFEAVVVRSAAQRQGSRNWPHPAENSDR